MGLGALVALAAALGGAPVARASLTPRDAHSTVLYLRAARAFDLAFEHAQPSAEHAAAAYSASVSAQCPGVLAHAPKGRDLRAISGEALLAAGIALLQPVAQTALPFARGTRRLRWSDRVLTRAVRLNAGLDEAETGAALPPLCEDARAWAAGGFVSLPPGVVAFVAHRERLSEARGSLQSEQILRMLGRLSPPAAAALLHDVETLDRQVRLRLVRMVFRAVNGALVALGQPSYPAELQRLAESEQ